MENICFVTIDCWRTDSLQMMDNLLETTGSWEQREAATASAATHGAFPALMAGSYELNVYEEDGTLRPGVETVADILGDVGYQTAGIIASNPFCSRWGSRFDHFENDGLGDDADTTVHKDSAFSQLSRLISFKKRVPADSALSSAQRWWSETNSPKFLWVHLMEPHEPFYPGFKRGISAGPLRSYISLVRYARDAEDIPSWMQRQIKNLYNECVRQLDDHLAPFLEWLPNDTVKIVTGDHGEEFDHGMFEHARMYNETVRVPYLTNKKSCAPDSTHIRQIDIPATLLSVLGLDVPDTWDGKRATYDKMPIVISMNTSPNRNRTWIAAHDETQKLIRTFDLDGELINTERYNLRVDPDETEQVQQLPEDKEFIEALDALWERDGFDSWIGTTSRPGLDGTVESRLEQLGYK